MRLDLEQWRDLSSPFFDVYLQESEGDGFFDVDVDMTRSQGLLTSKVTLSAQMLVHDPAANKETSQEYLLFERFYSGGGHGVVADTRIDITPNRLHVVDMSQHYQTMQQQRESRGICIPHAALGYAVGEDPVQASIELDSSIGRLISTAHIEMLTAQEHGSEEDAALLVQTFLELVSRLMLRRGAGDNGVQDHDLPLSLLLRDFVGVHLDRPDLDVDKITSVFGVSRATVYRHFDEEGGVLLYIRNRRLDRCFFELAKAQPERGRVTAIARRWHFSDATHFNRLFRERFGMSPSQCLATGMPPGDGAPSELIGVTQAWLERFRSA